ncbi:hypothetical protein [Streptomyces sp. NPDC086010]|uniref:hypothetical protein n=1 Tax=Streptomyces sp. NPDC086010 TaxID=3365745 RepID=UPI0037CFDD1F
MLHTSVVHTSKEIRDALDKSVERLEASGQAAQVDTTRAVNDELNRMRVNFREVRDRLSGSGEMLSAEVRQALAGLHAELRDVHSTLSDIAANPPAPVALPATEEPHPAPLHHEAPGPWDTERNTAGSDTAAAAAGPAASTAVDARPTDHVLAAIPPQRRPEDDTDLPDQAAIGLTVDQVQQAVHEAIVNEMAAVREEMRSQMLVIAGELRDQLSHDGHETHRQVAALLTEVRSLHEGIDQLRVQTAPSPAATVEVPEGHSALLQRAAQVSSVNLFCHRDVWEFVSAHAGRHPHFRVPPQVADNGHERIEAAVSGRSLIALLISLHSVAHTASDGDGDKELAATLYERIETSLASLTRHGEPVTITLDDRSPTEDAPATRDAAPDPQEIPASEGTYQENRPEPSDGSSPS